MEELKRRIIDIVKEYKINDGIVKIRAKVLTPEEAIGNPEHDDYPIQKGRERMVQADFDGDCGVAFTDMYGNFEGSLYGILDMELTNNYRRAIFISTINACLNRLGLIIKTMHCRDQGPVNCQKQVTGFIKEKFRNPRIFLAGFQPRLCEALSRNFEIRTTDMDIDNIGKEINSVTVESSENTDENIEWCDLIFATGTTFVNGTFRQFITEKKPTVFYGVTCAGPVHLLNLARYCPEGF
ncbi:MAG: DUF364 domain-containing protein [Spirochaetota bacterium]|nr:DUF364 domain-containing protein [Spirochaetota bacterium]